MSQSFKTQGKPRRLKQKPLTLKNMKTGACMLFWFSFFWYPSILRGWNSNTLATSCKELTHWKRPCCWEGLGAGGEGDDRGWDGWMASPTQWMSLSELQEMLKDTETWRAAIHGVTKSWAWLSNWTEYWGEWVLGRKGIFWVERFFLFLFKLPPFSFLSLLFNFLRFHCRTLSSLLFLCFV